MKSATAIAVPFMGVKPRLRRAASLVAVLLLGLALGGCERNYTFAQAKTLFDSHREAFEHLVTAIDRCGGAETINADSALNTYYSQCSRESTSFRDGIAKELAILHIESATIAWSPDGKLYGINFVLTSYGIAGHGTGSAIAYYPDATRQLDISVPSPQPLTSVPSHWWFFIAK